MNRYGAITEVLRRFAGLDVDSETLRPFMRKGFPWHNPDRANTPMRTADNWWAAMQPVFEGAFVGCGLPRDQARTLAGEVRSVYTDVLRELLADEWTHVILSNHVPELPSLVHSLRLSPLIHRIVNSAETGFEKPHSGAFQAALTSLDRPEEVGRETFGACGNLSADWWTHFGCNGDVEKKRRCGGGSDS